jgi:L-threonylcarbamoyladenylate synthase
LYAAPQFGFVRGVQVLPIDPNALGGAVTAPERALADAAVDVAVAALRSGRLVALPTETVYGLGAVGTDPGAVARIFAAKQRPTTNPLILHVTDEAMAKRYARTWPDAAARLAAAFWPGPLTVIVPRAEGVPDEVTAGGDSVALRAPSHPVMRAVIERLGQPIAAPSANRYQSVSPTRAAHVLRSLAGREDLIALVLDAGTCHEGLESTVVDVTSARPRLLRWGAVSAEAVARVLPTLELPHQHVALREGERALSPGLAQRHYAPAVPLEVFEGSLEAHADERLLRRLAQVWQDGHRVAMILRGPASAWRELAAIAHRLWVRVLPADPVGFGRELYDALQEADTAAPDVILLQGVPPARATYGSVPEQESPTMLDGWEPVRDRLRRAMDIKET